MNTKFHRKIDKSGECWEWTGYCMPNGYAQVTVDGKRVLFHRLMWTLTNGEIPKGMQVLHDCDNRKCGRPDHLFLGTNQDNVTDMIRKGRHRHGETHHNAKLTDADVVRIRASSAPMKVLAAELNIDIASAYRIRKGTRRSCRGKTTQI